MFVCIDASITKFELVVHNTTLRYPSSMVALEPLRDGGVYIFYTQSGGGGAG